jgi:hypothetical protein
MSLKIHSVENGKTANEEKVWLNTTEAVNLKGYAVIDRTFASTGQLSNEFRHIFVFPELTIGRTDWVKLYTGKGTYNKERISDGSGYIHNFYWGSSECVWNNSGGDVASLIKYNHVNSVNVPAV